MKCAEHQRADNDGPWYPQPWRQPGENEAPEEYLLSYRGPQGQCLVRG